MKLLAIEHDVPGTTPDQFAPYLKAEARHVWELQQSGIIRECHFREDRNSAVLVLECSGEDEARRVLGTLSLVENGFITFEIIPLKPYPGFARLFGEQD